MVCCILETHSHRQESNNILTDVAQEAMLHVQQSKLRVNAVIPC